MQLKLCDCKAKLHVLLLVQTARGFGNPSYSERLGELYPISTKLIDISGHVFMMTEKMLVCDYTDNNFDDMITNTVKNMEMIICDNDADWFG